MKKRYRVTIAIIALVLCLLCVYYGISLLVEQKNQQANFISMKDIAYPADQYNQENTNTSERIVNAQETGQEEAGQESEQEESEVVMIEDIIPKLPDEIHIRALQEEYPDVYAWVQVPGTNVDYAIVQHPTEDGFYLNHGYKKETTSYGAVYSEARNKKDFSDPMTVLYGHNMRDGSMFASLHRFEDKAFFDEHREFYIYTEGYRYTYRIFGAYTFRNIHLLKGYDFSKEEEFENYLKEIYAIRSMGDYLLKEPEVTTKDKIVTLSTCKGSDHSIRYLVQGVLTETQLME